MHFCVTTTVNIMVAHHIPHHYSDHYYYYYYITLYYIIGQANMADHMRRHRVRWLGHAARKPNDVNGQATVFLRTPSWATLDPWGTPTFTWMDTAMHDMGSLGHTLQIDLPRDWASLALHRDVWRGVVSRC